MDVLLFIFTKNMKYKIAIVDDRPQVILSVTDELNYVGSCAVVLTARNGAEFLEKIKLEQPANYPDVVLMDIDMPVLNGIETVKIAKQLYEGIKYIMLTVFDNDDKLFEAIKAGADGYLLKEERIEVIIASINEVIELNGAPMSPTIARRALNLLTLPPVKEKSHNGVSSNLSDRELEILKSLVDGLDYKKIAENLFISPNTVRNHIAKIYNKLYVTSKSQAVKLALKNKWV